MSGTLAQHRPGSKPQFIGGQPVWKVDKDGRTVIKWVTEPGGEYKAGRCVDWRHYMVPVQRHVLDYTRPADRPSKHAKGRTRPRNRAERQRWSRVTARAIQARKSITVDFNRLAGMSLIDYA